MGNKKKRDSFEALNLAGINLIQFQYEIALKKKRKKKDSMLSDVLVVNAIWIDLTKIKISSNNLQIKSNLQHRKWP
jgi:hypothetical protein